MLRPSRWLITMIGLILFAACSDDDPGPVAPEVPAGHWEEASILCSGYQDNRFFRLDLPPYPGGAHEELGYWYPDVPGRDPSSEFIDVSSIRVFRSLDAGPPEANDLPYAAAALDTTGRWDVGHIDGLSLDSWHPAWYWRPVPLDLRRDEDGHLVAVDLRREMARDDLLAVAYQVVDADGNTLYVVGDHPELGGEPGLEIDGQAYYRLKLLKPELRDHFTFQYVLRNIYDLGARNIDLDGFELRIESRAPVDHPELHENGLDYLRLFGLDRENGWGDAVPDGLADSHRPELFNLEKGLLTFPLDFPFPFGADEEIYRSYASADPINWMWEDTRLQHQTEVAMYYHWQTRPQDYSQFALFQLVVRHWVADPAAAPGADRVSLDRVAWAPASLPVHPGTTHEERAADIRWYRPAEPPLRAFLEPDLEGPARLEGVTALELAVNPDEAPWDWAGIMTGFRSPGLNLLDANRLVIWINDFAWISSYRAGTLHVDLGQIDEDFQWRRVDGSVEYGTFEDEDLNRDGILATLAEDVGLDALVEYQSFPVVLQEGRPFSAERTVAGHAGEYPLINATARNNRQDTEDLDHDGYLDRGNRYLSWSIDLARDEAEEDARRDHPEAELDGTAWRKYVLLLADADRVEGPGKYETEFLDRFSHLRIWIESAGMTVPRRVQIARLHFE